MSICGEQTDYFDIEINPDSTIKKIEVYTIGKLYRTGEDYYKNYRSISKCMVDNIGKPDYMDGGNNKPDGMKTVGWRFPDSKTIFMIYTYDAPIQTDQVKRLYKMVWTNYEPDKNKGL
jgi:hypothetical protein